MKLPGSAAFPGGELISGSYEREKLNTENFDTDFTD
jgi:hypothetical protein